MKSTFKGHSVDVTTQNNIFPALYARYMDVWCANFHNVLV